MMYAQNKQEPNKEMNVVIPTNEEKQVILNESKCQKCGRSFGRGLTMHTRFCKG